MTKSNNGKLFSIKRPLVFAFAPLALVACAKMQPTLAVRPAIGTVFAAQQAGLTDADQKRLAKQCPLGQPKLQRVEDYGMTYVVARDGYALEESEQDKIPIWVCERITRQQVTGSLSQGRIPFRADPALPEKARSQDKDYRGSGYDRGHQAPLADQTRDQRLRDETFFLSNVVPQNRRLNQQAWAALEARVRDWAIARDSVFALTGPLFWDPREDDPSTARGYVDYELIGNHVSVPTHIYKILVARTADGTGWESLAFVVPNAPYDRTVDLSQFIKSISWIQKRAGLTFFPLVPAPDATRVLRGAVTMWTPE